MTSNIIVVKAEWDAEARVWYVAESDLPGLIAEAETLEGLLDKLPPIILDLFEAAGDGGEAPDHDVPVELIAHASTRVRVAAA